MRDRRETAGGKIATLVAVLFWLLNVARARPALTGVFLHFCEPLLSGFLFFSSCLFILIFFPPHVSVLSRPMFGCTSARETQLARSVHCRDEMFISYLASAYPLFISF